MAAALLQPLDTPLSAIDARRAGRPILVRCLDTSLVPATLRCGWQWSVRVLLENPDALATGSRNRLKPGRIASNPFGRLRVFQQQCRNEEGAAFGVDSRAGLAPAARRLLRVRLEQPACQRAVRV